MTGRSSACVSWRASIAVNPIATPAFMSRTPGPHARPCAMRKGIRDSVPKGQTVSRWPRSRMGGFLFPFSANPKRSSSTSPKARWRCRRTRPPSSVAIWETASTQRSTAALLSLGDSISTMRRTRSINCGSSREDRFFERIFGVSNLFCFGCHRGNLSGYCDFWHVQCGDFATLQLFFHGCSLCLH